MHNLYQDLLSIGGHKPDEPINEVYTKDRYGSEREAHKAFIRNTQDIDDEAGEMSAWDREVRELRRMKKEQDVEAEVDKRRPDMNKKPAMQVAVDLIVKPKLIKGISQRLDAPGKKKLRRALISASQRAEALAQSTSLSDRLAAVAAA